jgi:hypothetical protein
VPRYLISFDDGAMAHISEDDVPAVSDAAHAMVQEAKAAGVWVFGGGLLSDVEISVVGADGTVTTGTKPATFIGGMAIFDVPSREDALDWATKIAVACRCPQEVREFLHDPEA